MPLDLSEIVMSNTADWILFFRRDKDALMTHFDAFMFIKTSLLKHLSFVNLLANVDPAS